LENRIFFVLPWAGHTLVGTTEAGFEGNPDNLKIGHESIRYLLERSQTYLTTNWQESDIQATFSGLRWLAVEDGHDLSSTSRAYVISEHKGGRGLLLTLYGGKLTTYRRLARTIGDRIAKHFGEFRPSLTHLSESWVGPEAMAELNCESRMIDRFLPGGVSYTPKGF
jgi:glycerol-3-phosphate dehydrogenase